MSLRRFVLTLGACLPAVSTLAAQTAVERTVTGLVVDSVSGRAVRGAVLYFFGERSEHQGDRDGRFSIAGASITDTLLVIRAIGYVPVYLVVPRSPSASMIDVGRVLIRPVATRLDEIAVEAEEVRLAPALADFYRRKQEELPGGTYITREDIGRAGVRRTSEILQRSPKIEMTCPNVRLGDDACTSRNRRGRDVRLTQGGWTFDRCEMDIFVDGQRTSLKVDEIPLSWIAGIEVYASAATTPAVFGIARCGVIAIWTNGARG